MNVRTLFRSQVGRIAGLILIALTSVLLLSRAASDRYSPAAGDVVFQSLGRSKLGELIEGSTDSRFSHCGLVLKKGDDWFVIEAIGPVREIALPDWIAQGHGAFAAFRLRAEYEERIPAMIASARTFLGRPYDHRFRFDDEKIYCSELVFKAFQSATGEMLGRVRKVRELNWEPYRAFIEELEGGPVPLDREMITPRDVSEAWQLREVYRTGL